MDQYNLTRGALAASVNIQGAELCSLVHATYGELLWQAEPAWPQHAPNLFPIVGQLSGDALRVDGVTYTLGRHGFARRRRFEVLEANAAECLFQLTDDEQTRAVYPFAFAFRVGFALEGNTLRLTYTIENTGDRTLPASVGAHPAFRWPLAAGITKEQHTLTFSNAEAAPIRRLENGLLKEQAFTTPVRGRVLPLTESLFTEDAIIFDRLTSRSVSYTAPGAPAIDVSWDRFRELGVWSKPSADFVCIEPWYGYASPVGFDGPFEEKPGLLHIRPGDQEQLTLSISVR